MSVKNIFCKATDLVNEADVEQNFVRRLLETMGYSDIQIRPKHSLTQLSVGAIGKKEGLYRPDFALKIYGKVRWIVEAKTPGEALDDHLWQPRSYCSLINGQYQDENPVKFYFITNGKESRLYKTDVNKPLIVMKFSDFEDKNSEYKKLLELLHPGKFEKGKNNLPGKTIELKKNSISEVNSAFAWCHQQIYKKDNISQASAFYEFIKVIFLKLLSDKRIKDKYPELYFEESVNVPVEDVTFSMHWITAQEQHSANPLDTIQFRNFVEDFEKQIIAGKRKRIFRSEERIVLSPETIKSVVAKIESIFLFGIDADLNGRLFETFLNATMRGKDLGQYFTPRSIVRLITKLAVIRVNVSMPDGARHTDKVIDACCGTGGFLIDALSIMCEKVDKNPSLNGDERDELKSRIANHHIYGIDVGIDPPLARIARMNMYLHGDGGSSIFQTDALDKNIEETSVDSAETLLEKRQLKKLIGTNGFANIALTNPPFAKVYERQTEKEKKILDEYRLGFDHAGNKVQSVRSSLLFIERYHDILVPGGTILTVVDDGILSGRAYAEFRKFVRDYFIVRGVISLPGDAFQRSKARVKTSVLIMEKKGDKGSLRQPSVFMYACEWVGIDDPSRQRTLPIDKVNRKKADEEIERVVKLYEDFKAGTGDAKYVVPPERIANRMDVKSCLYSPGRVVDEWKRMGKKVVKLSDIVKPVITGENDIIKPKESDDELVRYLRVTYEGFATADDEMLASDTTYNELTRVRKGQLAISNIAATYGSIAIIPPECDGCVVSSEYTVLETQEDIAPEIAWVVLRMPEVRADMLLVATGANRTRVSWDAIKDIRVALPDSKTQKSVIESIRQSDQARREAERLKVAAYEAAAQNIKTANSEAETILRAFKPPK